MHCMHTECSVHAFQRLDVSSDLGALSQGSGRAHYEPRMEAASWAAVQALAASIFYTLLAKFRRG